MYLNGRIEEYERWKEVVAGEAGQVPGDMTFLEFMAKLDREVDRNEKKRVEAERQLKELNKHRHGK